MNTDINIDIRHEVDFMTAAPVYSRGLLTSVGLCVVCLMISFALLLFSTPRAMAASQTVILKQDVYLSDNVITVGDVFENAGSHADHVLAAAPAAGDTMVLGYNDLKRIADAFNYEWNATGADRIVLQRAVSEVDKSDITRLVEASVYDALGETDNLEISIDTVLPRLLLDGRDTPELSVANIKTDLVNNRFNMDVIAKNAQGTKKTIDLSGHFYRLTNIPVLAVNLKKGDVIRNSDINLMTVRQEQINQNIALRLDDLVGMAPRRSLTSDKPVNMADLERPQIVEKGDIVTMVLKNGPMTLTAKGKALDDGSMGDTIRVLNASSNRTVDAEVTGPQRATITLETNRI